MSVVMPDELDQDALYLAPVEDQKSVEALSANGPYEPLPNTFARGERTRVRRIRMPSEQNTSSNRTVNLESRSRTRNLAGGLRWARTKLRLRACWTTHSPAGVARSMERAARP